MNSIWSIKDTLDLIRLVERFDEPASFLTNLLFPNVEVLTSDVLPIEYVKNHRRLAPYVVRGVQGVDVKREGSSLHLYKAPLTAPRRVIGLEDVSRRIIGEQPIVSSLTPETRAAQMLGRDLDELQTMIANRKEQQAAELLQTGKVTIAGYTDEGEQVVDVIDFRTNGVIQKDWSVASADIYSDLKDASEAIQEAAGLIPTLMICGKNVEKYLLNNKSLREIMLSASSNAVAFMTYQPRYDSPQSRLIGNLAALNMEIRSFTATYLDDTGRSVPFIGEDNVIICVPGRGRQMHGAVTLLENGEWRTYSAEYVPHYSASEAAQTTSLTLYSRFLLVPETVDDFVCLKVK